MYLKYKIAKTLPIYHLNVYIGPSPFVFIDEKMVNKEETSQLTFDSQLIRGFPQHL